MCNANLNTTSEINNDNARKDHSHTKEYRSNSTVQHTNERKKQNQAKRNCG